MPKITKDPELKKYTEEELQAFNNSLNRYYNLHSFKVEEREVEAEILDFYALQQAFINAKPEVPREERVRVFENLFDQWKRWKFAEHYKKINQPEYVEPYWNK